VALETAFFDASVSNYIMLEFDHKFTQGDGSICKIQAKDGNTWIDIMEFSTNINTVTHEIVDLSGVIGGVTNAKLRFVWNGNGSGYWAFDNVRIFGALPIDVGISKIDNPVPPLGLGDQAVKVSLKNYGYSAINSAEIHWSVDNQPQPTFNWSGSLSFGQTQGEIEIGNYNFEGSGLLKVWSEKPNNQEDPNHFNDTTKVDLINSLCGVYTIGGENPDFVNFVEANNVLQLAGVSCAVVFKVRDGIYNEQFVMNDIPGSSEVNTITFESESQDSNAVTLSYNSYPNAVVKIKNASHIRFRGIGFNGYYGLFIDENSNDIIIQACKLIAIETGIAIRSGSNDIEIKDTKFDGSNYGISLNSEDGNVSIIPENQ